MIFNLASWYKDMDLHGGSVSCLQLYLETANMDLRNRIQVAIEKALAGEKLEPEQKAGSLGFQYHGPEDE